MPAFRRLFPVTLVVLAVFAACGGDDPSDPDDDNGNPPGEEIPVAERMAALEAVEAEFADLLARDLTAAQLNDSIVAFLEARPEFMEVGVDDEASTVYAVFTDGRGLVIPNNLVLGASASAAHRQAAARAERASEAGSRTPDADAFAHARATSAARAAASAATGPAELPASRNALLLHTFSPQTPFGNGALDAIAEMSLMLQEAGWQVTSGGADASTVAALRAVSGVGFFYLNTHGGPGRTWYNSRIDGVFALQTSTIVTPLSETDDLTEADLDDGRLVYMIGNYSGAADDLLTYDMRYAFTDRFVEHYMSFPANAVVFLNACESGHEAATPARLAAAFRAKGASVVLGWTRAVNASDAWHAAKFLVDRMAGANRFEPEPSNHRPFPLQPVLDYMHELGYDASNGGQLRAIGAASGAGFGLLRPTIERVQIDTAIIAGGTMSIYGSFGSDPGASNRRVFMRDGGEVNLEVVGWTADSIRVRPVVNQDAAGFTGDVVVVSRQHESNPRRLYAWQGTADYVLHSLGSLQVEVHADFVGRFDADSTRAEPGEPAEANDHPQVFRVIPHPVVEARYAASGSAAMDDCTMTWSGSGAISSANPQPERSYVFDARLDPAAQELRVRQMQVIDIEGIITTCDVTLAGPVVFTALMFLPAGATEPSLPILVDDQWRLEPGDWSFTSGDGGATFHWPAVSPTPAYDPSMPK